MDDKEFTKKLAALIKTGEMEMLSTLGETFSINYTKEASNPVEKSSLVGERDYGIAVIFDRIEDEITYNGRINDVFKHLKTYGCITRYRNDSTIKIGQLYVPHVKFSINTNILYIIWKILSSFLSKAPNIHQCLTVEYMPTNKITGSFKSSSGVSITIHATPIHP